MKSTVVFVLTLTTITFAGLVHSLHISASENVLLVGSNVTLSSNVTVERWSWRFNDVTIVIVLQGSFYIGKSWENRTTLNLTTSSLTIRSLTVEDSGEYTFEKLSGDTFTEVLKLSVQEPISNVTLRAKSTNLVEFNDTAVLVCSVSSGTSLSYEWWMDNSTITNGDVQLSNKEATLSIVNVTHYYQGQYKCKVSNGFGQEFSGVVHLNINYGPSNTTMMVMPAKEVYKSGSNITLSCATQSSPPATVQWMFNDTYLDPYGPNLQLKNVLEGDTGHYKCVFHNNVTFRFSSKSTMIQVTAPVTAVVISRTSGPAILHESFTLKCEVTGRVDSIQWWRNDQQISADNRVDFGINKTLTLNPVQHSDGGRYSCRAFNSVSNMTSSPFEVQVNYGPDIPTITGPNVVKRGDNVTLSCNAASTPESSYVWSFDGRDVSTMSKYVTPALTKDLSGKYTCEAFNNITNKQSTAHIMITVVDPIENVRVQAEMKPAVENSSYALMCNVTGDADHIYWMKNNESLHDNETIIFQNMKLVFMSVQRSDTGYYRCMAKNAFGNMTSAPYMLIVNYGPDIPTITGPNVVKRGDNVTLSCNAASTPESSYVWSFDGRDVSTMSKYVTPALTKGLSWKYTCMAFNNITNKNSTAHIMITVVDPIENVRVQAEMKPAVENSSYALMCNVTGDADHIYWMKNNESLHVDNTTGFYKDKKTLMFMSVQLSDTGYYRCMGMNAFGNMTSAPYMLLVNFGPDKPIVDGPTLAETGSHADFMCSAVSEPPSHYTWWFNHETMTANTSVFTIDHLSLNMSGEYTCMAHNHVTGRNSTNSITLRVIEAIESVIVHNETTPINQKNFTLTCHVVGPYNMTYWMKDNMYLNMSTMDRYMSYDTDENMLHFTPVTRDHDGTYKCVAVNEVTQHHSPKYMLQVNYGPLSVTISGPEFGKEGTSMSLKCSADSRPECQFHWFLNNQFMILTDGPDVTFVAIQKYIGNYTCQAINPVTNITMYQHKAVTIAAHASTIHLPTQGGLMMMGLFAFSAHALFH
ncbi:carcinoembryonic antigen-related cell adhesion molecule 1 isoform 2-T2 [Odontesthes bonariensis]|uniref:carcinoembryonic antigen-related cell adhesion molecule 1 isoform X2 n=1 Tax=Odontesthes bonariensis TaxID=219752 RepID=UPI003F590109